MFTRSVFAFAGVLYLGCSSSVVVDDVRLETPGSESAELFVPAGTAVVASGGNFSCAIVSGGLVKCWGNNDFGQLGQGDTQARGSSMGDALPFVNLGAGRTAKAIAIGWGTGNEGFACAILNNDRVKCWGSNQFGQLGRGDTLPRGDGPGEMGDNLPFVDLGSGRTVRAISAHGQHVCALLDTNAVKCWGNNASGQLGLDSTTNRGDGPSEMGANLPQVVLGQTAKAVATGSRHSCAILNDNRVKCWGYNEFAALGRGNITPVGDGVNDDMAELQPVNLGTNQGVERTAKAIAAGGERTCVVLNNDAVKCWGNNQDGLVGVGVGEANNKIGDVQSEMGNGLPVINLGTNASGTARTAKAITQGRDHTCVVLNDNAVKCWGFNQSGQLGLGNEDPRGATAAQMGNGLPLVALGTNRTARAITAGDAVSCAVLDNNKAKCWGRNGARQLGIGSSADRGDGPDEMGEFLPAINLGSRSQLTATAGSDHTCSLFLNGQATCWGGNASGQLGLASVPVGSRITSPSTETIALGSTAQNLAAGTAHTCARLANNQLKCWGSNFDGQLGLGDNVQRAVPASAAVNLGTGLSAVAVAAGGSTTCALLNTNQVKCWGDNGFGQLGRGNTTDLTSPNASVINLGTNLTATQVSVGLSHVCAVLSNNQIKCWGQNSFGQLGLGSFDHRGDAANEMGDALPTVALGTGRSARSVAAGDTHTCALLDNFRVKCWGGNLSGQLGLGDTAARGDNAGEMGDSLPTVALVPGSNTRALAVAGSHSCAISDTNETKCWGENGFGQLGVADNADRGDTSGEMGASLPLVNVAMSGGLVAQSLHLGPAHTCALLNSTQLNCWGNNGNGQLGIGSQTNRNSPSLAVVNVGPEP